jgi:hypothetical protein
MIVMIGGDPEDWGLIPGFLDESDERGAREQFNARYIAGWQPFEGFTFDPDTEILSYPGDPPMKALSIMMFRNEIIMLFPSAWVMVLQPDNTWEICRMD